MSDSSSPTSRSWAVLKIAHGGEFRRVPLRGERAYQTVEAAVLAEWSSLGDVQAFYQDEEGDECRLVASTFADFLATAKPTFEEAAERDGRPVLRLRLRSPAPRPPNSTGGEGAAAQALEAAGGPARSASEAAQRETCDEQGRLDGERRRDAGSAESAKDAEDAGGSAPPPAGDGVQDHQVESSPDDSGSDDRNSGSDLEEEDALALAEEARRACEEVLAEHLRGWLAAGPPSVAFEAWLRDVHPENVRRGAVDPRMYLQASFHRQLWNELAAGAAGLTAEERDRRLVPARLSSAAAQPDLTPSAPLLSELLPVVAGEPLASSLDATPSAPLLSELLPAQHEAVSAGGAAGQEGGGPAAAGPPRPVWEPAAAAGQGGSGPAAAGPALPVWKLAAAPYIARALPVGAQLLRRLRRETDQSQPELPESFRRGYRLLGEALADLGPKFRPVAEAASDLASGEVLHGTGAAELAARASRLHYKDRLRYADALCDCCPEVILSCFPEFARPCGAAGGPSARYETAEQVKAGARAAQREHQEAVKAAKEQLEAEVKHFKEAQRQAPAATAEHKRALKQAVEEQQRAARQAAQAHAESCRQMAKAHAAAQKAAAEAQRAASRRAAEAHRAAAAQR